MKPSRAHDQTVIPEKALSRRCCYSDGDSTDISPKLIFLVVAEQVEKGMWQVVSQQDKNGTKEDEYVNERKKEKNEQERERERMRTIEHVRERNRIIL